MIQRRAPLISAPNMRRGRDQREADQEDDQRKAADLAGRQDRGAKQHRHRRNKKQHMPVDEVERVEPDAAPQPAGWRPGENDAAQHQRQQGSQHQPSTVHHHSLKGVALRARRHDIPKAELPKVIPLSGGTRVVYTGLRKGRIWATGVSDRRKPLIGTTVFRGRATWKTLFGSGK